MGLKELQLFIISRINQSLVSMIASKSPPATTKYERFSDFKRYFENIHQPHPVSSSQPSHPQSYAKQPSHRNPYLSPISINRLQQLQLGKRFLREMKNGTQSLQYSALHSPQNKLLSGVPNLQVPKRNPQARYGEMDASHGVHSFQVPVIRANPGQSSRSQSKHKKNVSTTSREYNSQPLTHPPVVSPLSSQLQCESRISPNNTKIMLYLQPWSIYYIPGEDPNTFSIPPARKIPPNEKIEKELKDFKKEIDQKFAKTPMKQFVFPRTQSYRSDEDENFVEFGDDIAVVTDNEEDDFIDGRHAPPPPNPRPLVEQKKQIRTGLGSGGPLRQGTKPSPLRPGFVEGFDKRFRSSRSSSKEASRGQSGSASMKGGKSNSRGPPASFFKGTTQQRPHPKLVPQNYTSQAVAALVSPTTRTYEKKLALMKQQKEAQQLMKDISFERKPPHKRKKLKLADLNGTDYALFKRNSSNFSPQYQSTVVPSARAWEEQPQIHQVAQKLKTHGGGTGAPLTPPPHVVNEVEAENQKQSPRGMTHRSFLIPGEKAEKQLQSTLHKSGSHSKSQSYKQKFIPGGGIGPPGLQVFTPSTGKIMKKQRTPREVAQAEQISGNLTNPSPISGTGGSKPPSGGTGSITSHQQQQSTHTNSFRSLRQKKSNSNSRKPQPLTDIGVTITPTRGPQTGKPMGAYSAQPRLLPPEMIQSVYLKQSPQGRVGASSVKGAAVGSRAAHSAQQYYGASGQNQYHGNWSILGSAGKGANEQAVYISHQSVKPKAKVKPVHQRAKTSHIESSQSQLPSAHNSESQYSKNSGRRAQQQQSQYAVAGRKKKNSVKQSSASNTMNKTSFDLNDSFDTMHNTTTVATRTALHSNTLSRELNMINKEIQNADQTMKLLVDAEDLKLGYLKPNSLKDTQRMNLRNVALKSPTNIKTPAVIGTGLKANTPGMPASPTYSSRAYGSQRPVKQLQEQYKRRFKSQLVNASMQGSIQPGTSSGNPLSTSAEPVYLNHTGLLEDHQEDLEPPLKLTGVSQSPKRKL